MHSHGNFLNKKTNICHNKNCVLYLISDADNLYKTPSGHRNVKKSQRKNKYRITSAKSIHYKTEKRRAA